VSDDRPFRSVSHALRIGYSAEASPLYQRDSTFSQYRPHEGGVRLPQPPYFEGFTAHDRAAEAGKVVGITRRTLTGAELFAVEAYYLPNDKSEPGVIFRKQHYCSQLIPIARQAVSSPPPDAFIAAVVREWANLADINGEALAKQLGVNRSTIMRWRKAHKVGRQINDALNERLDNARRLLGQPMRQYGLVP
jgi:transposase-like protein